jgi:protein TonB
VIALASIAFVIVVAVGGWLFFLLLQKFGTAKEGGAETATTGTATVDTTATAVPLQAAATATAPNLTPAPTTVAPTAVPLVETPKPAVKERPSKPRAPRTPPPTETVAPTVTAAETAPPPPVEPAVPAVKEGDIVGPGEGVVDAQIARKVEPLSPPASAVMGNRGFAMFSVLVGIDGSVEIARIIRSSGSAAFDDLATAAAKKATFTPATKDGVRVKMWRTLRYDVKTRGM